MREAGGLPVLLPGIRIEPLDVAAPTGAADWIIFISPNAVQHGLEHVRPLIDAGAQVAAIGPTTARALSAAGIRQPLSARDGFDSESMLRLSVFRNLDDVRIIIVRGVGGRSLLIDELAARGARVSVFEVYRRDRPTLSPEQVQYLETRWAQGVVAVTTCLSVATLDNLMTLLTTRCQRMFMVTPMLSPSARVLERAEQLGHKALRVQAGGPEVGDLVEGLLAMARAGQI